MALYRRNSSMPPWAPKLVIFGIASVLATILSVYVIVKLQDLISWLLLALFLSFALEPLVNQLVKRGWKRTTATATVILGLVILIVLLIAAMIPMVIDQSNEIIKQSPEWLASLINTYNNLTGANITQSEILQKLTVSEQFVSGYITNIAGNAFGFGRQLLLGFLEILGIMLFTFYFILDAPQLRRFICSMLSIGQQKVVLSTWELAIEKTGGFMYSRLILGLISTVLHFILFTVLGIPFALPLALWMGVISQFIPIVGTYIAAALPLIASLTQGPAVFVLVLAFILLYQQLENYYLLPKVAAQTMELHPAVAFAAVIAGIGLGGIIGAFLALPVAAMVQEATLSYLSRNEVIKSDLVTATPKRQKNK